MNNARWFWFAIAYQCGFAYIASLCVYQLGMLFSAGAFGIGTIAAFVLVAVFIWLLFRKQRTTTPLEISNARQGAGA